jgi:hypothetical protein
MCYDTKHEYMNFSLTQSFSIMTWQKYDHVTENLQLFASLCLCIVIPVASLILQQPLELQ